MPRDPDPSARPQPSTRGERPAAHAGPAAGPAQPSIELVRLARDVDTGEWHAELSCPLADRGTARLVVARGAALRPAELFRDLAGKGVVVPEAQGRRRLLDALLRTEDAAPARLVRRTGWAGDSFVSHAEVVVGPAADLLVDLPPGRADGGAPLSGTLEGWRRGVAEPAACSSRLMLLIALALGASLLRWTEAESGCVNLWGRSTTGKSLGLLAANSVWRSGARARLLTWGASATGREELAAEHCDTTLCLDEVRRGAADAEEAARVARESAYVFASGVGRVRARRYGERGDLRTWRVNVASSSELPLFASAGPPGQRFTGDRVRLADVPARVSEGLGIFERLPAGVGDPRALATALEAACATDYGWAGPVFVAGLVARREHWLAEVGRWREFFARKAEVPDEAWERRFAARFGLAYAAGRAGIAMGVLPWGPKPLRLAITACYRDARAGGVGGSARAAGAGAVAEAVAEAVARVRARLRAGEGLLDLRGSGGHRAAELAAAVAFRKADREEGELYAVRPAAFEGWCGGPGPAREVLAWLGREGHLIPAAQRSSYRQVMVAGIPGRARYVCVRAGFVAGPARS